MRRRIILVIILLGAVAYAPWWFSVLLTLIALWRLGSGYELLLPAVIADLAYGPPNSQFFGLAYPATFLTALSAVLARVLARRFFLHS